MALQAALEEVSLWIRQRGSEDVACNINGALETLNQNAEFIAKGRGLDSRLTVLLLQLADQVGNGPARCEIADVNAIHR
jgi:hypothetical protein